MKYNSKIRQTRRGYIRNIRGKNNSLFLKFLTADINYLLYRIFRVSYLFLRRTIRRSVAPHFYKRRTMDKVFFTLMLILILLGSVMVYSSSGLYVDTRPNIVKSSTFFIFKHLLFVLLGVIILVCVINMPYRLWSTLSMPLLIINIGLLILVLFLPAKRNVHRWINIGGFNFQPSEMAKLTVLVFISTYCDIYNRYIKKSFKGLLPAVLVVLFIAGLIYKEPDFGSSVLVVAIMMILFFLAGVKVRHLLILLILFAIVGIFGIKAQKYRNERLKMYFEEGAYTQTSITKRALISGGIFGRGLGCSEMKRHPIPDLQTDFIFSVIGEELGVFGTTFVVLLFLLYFYRGIWIGWHAPDFFSRLMSCGAASLLTLQAFIHIGVNVGILPAKGIPLPFISYGGSSLLINILLSSIALNISKFMEVKVEIR